MISAGIINQMIKEGQVNTSEVSDGFHTFGELYDHRNVLFIALCHTISLYHPTSRFDEGPKIWRSKLHSDGSAFEGFFIMGIGKTPGYQITYHIVSYLWSLTEFAETLDLAPEWDGHTPQNVIERLLPLILKTT